MNTIHLTDANLMHDAAALETQELDACHYDRIIRDTGAVLKPDGTPLLIYVADAVPRDLCRLAFQVFRDANLRSDNRGAASGGRFQRLLQDGTRSRTLRSRTPVNSGMVGFADRYPRIPYCRMTSFNLDHHVKFEAVRPFIVQVSDRFQAFAPERWTAQRTFLDGVKSDYVIRDTVFTTMTVNDTWRTHAHYDKGDLRVGLGVMAVVEGGRYKGGELIFPKFRTAVDMRTGGLCLADVHELHGNAPMTGSPGFKRLSFVFYAREGMKECGTPTEERERAKRLDREIGD